MASPPISLTAGETDAITVQHESSVIGTFAGALHEHDSATSAVVVTADVDDTYKTQGTVVFRFDVPADPPAQAWAIFTRNGVRMFRSHRVVFD